MSTQDPASKGRAVRAYGAGVDFGRVSGDYAAFRPGPPGSLYDRIELFQPIAGSRVLDVGTGTGVAALEFAARGARVVASDKSQEQIDAAREAASARGLDADFRVGSAESTGLDDASIDLYSASQCWHWFDPALAAREALRVLRPGGLAAVYSFDYIPGRSRLAADTEALILAHNPGWPMAGGRGCHINPLYDLPAAGFEPLEQISFEHAQPFTHSAWRGRMRTCNGVGGSLASDAVARFDAELADMLRERYPREPVLVTHRVWLVLARRPA